MSNTALIQDVENYYGEVLGTKDDLKTSACCPVESMPKYLHPLLKNIHDEVHEKFYGCGSPIPFAVEGATILDLGCGTGRDVYTLSQLVGSEGKVIGVDMTKNQLDVANNHLDYHMEKFGYKTPNVEFHKGFIEDLKTIGIADNSVDVVVSNCVINLSPNKKEVFKEIFRVLKPGGELFFSDVFADRRVPKELQEDATLRGECLGGALYIEDFRRILHDLNCLDYRVLSQGDIIIDNQELQSKLGLIRFNSMTVRAFKYDFEDICEDYGQVAYYKGGIVNSEHQFVLDDHHTFNKNQPMLVCGNSAVMVGSTRYGKYFDIVGDTSTHYGAFDCTDGLQPTDAAGACC